MQAAERLRTLARSEPWIVLAPLVVAQWVVLAVFALTVQRNGWLFYQGGDQTWFYTSAWELAHGRVPETLVGYLWPFLLAPLAFLAGPDFLDGLPVIILLQLLVLVPLAVLCAYSIAARIGGRLLGYFAAAAWIVAPFAAQPLFVGRYHERWNEQTLPQALGFTALGDFPSMVLLLVAAVFVLRALDGAGRGDVVAAGLVAGLAIALKPANGLFVFAPLVAFALARRWRAVLEFGVALIPALLTLVVWKYRGTGISVLALDPTVLAAAAEPPPHPTQLTWWEQVRRLRAARHPPAEPPVPRLPRVLLERAAARVHPDRRRDRGRAALDPEGRLLRRLARRVLRRQGLVARGERGDRDDLAAADAGLARVLLPRVSIPLLVPRLGRAAPGAVSRAAAGGALAAPRRSSRSRSCSPSR